MHNFLHFYLVKKQHFYIDINIKQDDSQDNYKKVENYLSYLNENSENWYISDKSILVKKDDVLSYMQKENKNLGITVVVQKEIDPNAPRLPIFMYHGVSDSPWGSASLFMSVSAFDEQMKYLSENGFRTIFASELYALDSYDKTVMITFDDAYKDFYTIALPIMQKYNIKSTLYVITDYVGGEFYISEDELKAIASSGVVEIGSHTLDHPSLSSLTSEDIERQMKDSKEYLVNTTGQNVATIAYPKGIYDSRVMNIASKYYNFAYLSHTGLTIRDKVYFHPFAIKRIGLYRGVDMNSFKSYCSMTK